VNSSKLKPVIKFLRLATILFLVLSNSAQYGFSIMICLEDEVSCCCKNEEGMLLSADAHGCCCEVTEVPRSDAMKSPAQTTLENLICLFTIPVQNSEYSVHSDHSLAVHELNTLRRCDICIVNSNLRI
jgi:hypothetical protein